jgi:peptidoglycan/LPS O-acetylase OafA/YrhL
MMDSPNLDFLRANAVLMVLVFHVLGFFGIRHAGPLDLEAMGHLGVLLFFVHTSFVLMLSLERQLARYGRHRLFLIFMLRRFFRIYPLSLFIVGVIVLFRLPLAGHPWSMNWPALGAGGVLSNALLIQNLTGTPSVQGPLWSLPVEMQMYLLLPALFLLARRLKSPWTPVAGWVLMSSSMFVWLRSGHDDILQYVPCFLPGIVAYAFSFQKRLAWPFLGWPLLLWSSLVLFMVVNRLEVGWLICFAVGTAALHFVEMSNRWLCRASHLIARYSYGIYLTHYFCIWLAFAKLSFLPWPGRWVIFIAGVVMIPIVLYHLLELPVMNVGKKLAERLAAVDTQMVATKAATTPSSG